MFIILFIYLFDPRQGQDRFLLRHSKIGTCTHAFSSLLVNTVFYLRGQDGQRVKLNTYLRLVQRLIK
jgi:hypothetical protein